MLTLERRGENITLPPDLVAAVRLYDLVAITGWSRTEIASTPAALTERLLAVHRATKRALRMTDDERDDLMAGAIRRRLEG